MIGKNCTFESARLLVTPWHLIESRQWLDTSLESVVVDLLTEPVTRLLPPAWQGGYTAKRAREWIEERDSEGSTLLIVEKSSKEPIGLMILFAAEDGVDVEMRIGFLFAESTWGKGFASELLGGFIDWCRTQPGIKSIAGGVAPDNMASKRVMEKHGFRSIEAESAAGDEDELYRLDLRG